MLDGQWAQRVLPKLSQKSIAIKEKYRHTQGALGSKPSPFRKINQTSLRNVPVYECEAYGYGCVRHDALQLSCVGEVGMLQATYEGRESNRIKTSLFPKVYSNSQRLNIPYNNIICYISQHLS